MKDNLRELFKKYSKEIEIVTLNRKNYYYWGGEDSENNYIYKIILKDNKILLFENLEIMFFYLENGVNNIHIFDQKNTSSLLKKLRKFSNNDIRKWLNDFNVINVDYLYNSVLNNHINIDNKKLHTNFYNYKSMLSDYFWQLGSKKKYYSINTKPFRDYYDFYLDNMIFSNKLNKSMNKILLRILNLKGFKKLVLNSIKYFEIY